MKEARVSVQPPSATFRFLDPVLPNRWQGEADCVVGPFSGRNVAEYFANSVVDFGQFETVSGKVFAKGDSWFVEVARSRVPPTILT
jgi:hypothetical protein